jgi:two-component system, sporulation sensor kinase E
MSADEASKAEQMTPDDLLSQRLNVLGRLAGSLAHELRNPLNAIFLHLDVAEEELRQPTPGDRSQIELSLAVVKEEVVRLHNLMEDYLSLARLSHLQCSPDNLRLLLEAVMRELQGQLEAHEISLRTEGLEGLGEIALHKPTLQRALLNMVRQVIEAMPPGENLTLRGWRTPSHVHLTVHHSGKNLQTNALPQPLRLSKTAAVEPSHLRLYVAQEIITAHGGVFEASSAPGEGMTFTVTLPTRGPGENSL